MTAIFTKLQLALTCVAVYGFLAPSFGNGTPEYSYLDYAMTEESANCPCSDPSWCAPVKVTYKEEVFAFSIRNDESHWKLFDWSRLTTVVMFGYMNTSLMCLAHSHNVRVVKLGSVGVETFTDATKRQQWILEQLTEVKSNFLDGINFDYEEAVDVGDHTVREAYTALVSETRTQFKRELPYSQITVDVAWKPNADIRYYDYPGLAAASDFLFVMAYDEQSQILGECLAGPNSALPSAKFGLTAYMKSYNIKPQSMVLGVPWYGYKYECINLEGEKCFIKEVPFRGVNCSDAAGTQLDISAVSQLMRTVPFEYRWNHTSQSPYIIFSLQNQDKNSTYQLHFDNPDSLSPKYELAQEMKLRGVGMWNIDSLDYTDSDVGKLIRNTMFNALPTRQVVSEQKTVETFEPGKKATCPCSNPQWCDPIKNTTRKEVFAFVRSNDETHWLQYDWTRITTVSMTGFLNVSLVCLAHSHNARATYIARVDEKTFMNTTLRQKWVETQLQTVQTYFLDGLNFDVEIAISKKQEKISKAYADLVNQTSIALKKDNPYAQITVDVLDSPYSSYRAYAYVRLAEAADFLFIMFYDESGGNHVGPNSGLPTAKWGIEMYLKDKIGVNKLLLGVPWYGYVYRCARLVGDDCYLKEKLTGVGAYTTLGYASIYALLSTMPEHYRWNNKSSTPFFSYTESSTNKSYQIQFDDPHSLRLKYNLASEKNLRGVGMWYIDCLDFSNTSMGREIRDSMFGVLPVVNVDNRQPFKSPVQKSRLPDVAVTVGASDTDKSTPSRTSSAKCPCDDPKLCEPIKDTTRKEVYAFSIKNDENYWKKYDWSKITTMCMYNYVNVSLMCMAHSHNARAVMLGKVETITMITPALRKQWIADQLKIVKDNFLDGLNFDVEMTIHPDQKDLKDAYTALVTETYQAFKAELPYSQISVDVIHDAFSVNCAYDYPALAAASDFLFIMAYDEYGYNQVGANADYPITKQSIDSYFKDKVSADKLVLGLPWYGYIYNCTRLEGDKCYLNESLDPSIRQAGQYFYPYIYNLLQTMPDKLKWNATSLSPYFSYIDSRTGKAHQVQFDNPKSLKLKYDLAAQKGVRGVGMWTIDFLDYTDTPAGEKMRRSMFDPLPSKSSDFS